MVWVFRRCGARAGAGSAGGSGKVPRRFPGAGSGAGSGSGEVSGKLRDCSRYGSGDGAGVGSGKVVGRLRAGVSTRVVADFRVFWASVCVQGGCRGDSVGLFGSILALAARCCEVSAAVKCG